MSRTMYDKIWDAHCVRPETEDTPAILAIDLHLIHEVTSPQAFTDLRERRMPVRRPDRTVATMDHSTPTRAAGADGSLPILDTAAAISPPLSTTAPSTGSSSSRWAATDAASCTSSAPSSD